VGIVADIKSLAGRSLIYGFGSVLGRSITFLLLPLYTRFLTPADYGVVAVSGTITAVLGIILPFGLHGAVAKYYFADPSESTRARTNGTIAAAIAVAAFVVTILADRFGNGLFTWLVPQVPFHPYVRLAIWTAFFSTFSLVPLALLQVQERATHYVTATLGSAVATAALIVYFVVVRGEGARGYLVAVCVSTGVAALIYGGIMVRSLRITVDRRILWMALVFSLPLVPHGLASWVLDVSDRVLLERFVPAAAIGLYALGFQFGAIANTVAGSMNSAWVPFVYKRVAEDGAGATGSLARLVSVFAIVLLGVGLALATLGQDIVLMLMAPAYRGAALIVPWIVCGYVFAGMYFVPANFLFVAERTSLIPVVTIAAGVLNVGLNLWLMPRYGVMAAAWTTLVSYAATLVFAWVAAQRVYKVPYEYARLARAAVTAGALYWIASTAGYGTATGVAAHVAAIAAFPVLLLAVGVVSPSERRIVSDATRRLIAWDR